MDHNSYFAGIARYCDPPRGLARMLITRPVDTLMENKDTDAPDNAPTPPFAGSWDKPEWPAEVILEWEG